MNLIKHRNIKFIIKFLGTILPLFAASALAANYAPGTNCHSNKECSKNCLDGQWTIVSDDGGYILACDPVKKDVKQYYSAACMTSATGGASPYFSNTVKSDDGTAKACSDAGGKNCKYACYLTGPKSGEDDARSTWEQSCNANNMYPKFEKYGSADTASSDSGC